MQIIPTQPYCCIVPNIKLWCLISGGSSLDLDLRLMGNVLDLTGTLAVVDLDITSLDVSLKLIETRLDLASPPWRNTAVKHSVHLLQRLSLSLWCCQEHVDKSKAVKGSKDLNVRSAVCSI
jgi:hypothetical protein